MAKSGPQISDYMQFVLVGKRAVEEPDPLKAVMVFGSNRTLKYTRFHEVDVEVSTVFLGYDTAFGSPASLKGHPMIFETMVFGGVLNSHKERYRDFDEAILGHHELCVSVAKAEAEHRLRQSLSKKPDDSEDPQP